MAGDNLTQNYPLRVLSGELLAHGRLPLWNPDIWSGAPLLAGWNAAAMYPGTWLFAFVPGVAAFVLNVIAVGVIGGLGLYVFVRRLGCSALAALLAALSFSYTGFMSGQSVHLGLVTGMAFAPWMLIAADRMAGTRSLPQLLRPVVLLGLCGGLVVLAGDPRAITNDAIVLAAYVAALAWRRGRSRGGLDWRLLSATGASGLLAVALSAVQWLPGLAFLGQSQRASRQPVVFRAGLAPRRAARLSALAVRSRGQREPRPPDYELQPAGAAPTRSGSCPSWRSSSWPFGPRLVGGGVTKGRQPLGVWLSLCVVGIVLSLGTNTPLGHLLVHIPLYGGERLQNRNMGIVDLALSVLLALFLDVLRVDEPSRHEPSAPAPFAGEHRPTLTLGERIAGATPPVLVVALIAAMVMRHRAYGTASRRDHPHPRSPGAHGALLRVRAGARNGGLVRRRAGAVEAAPSPSTAGDGGRARRRGRVHRHGLLPTRSLRRPRGSEAPPSPPFRARQAPTAGRSAIFNPQQRTVAYPPDVLDDLGLDDLVVLHHLESVQGYGSAVSAGLRGATGAHEVENLRPSSFLDPHLRRLRPTGPRHFARAIRDGAELTGRPRPAVGPAAAALCRAAPISSPATSSTSGARARRPLAHRPGPRRPSSSCRGRSPSTGSPSALRGSTARSAATRLRASLCCSIPEHGGHVTRQGDGRGSQSRRVPVGAVLAGGGALAVEVEALPCRGSEGGGAPSCPPARRCRRPHRALGRLGARRKPRPFALADLVPARRPAAGAAPSDRPGATKATWARSTCTATGGLRPGLAATAELTGNGRPSA